MPGYVKCVVLSGVAVSLWMARPERSPILRIAADGTWGLPRESLSGLRLLPGSTFTRSWARLRLAGPDGRCRIRRIWYDVFSDDDRRRLLIALRERRYEVR